MRAALRLYLIADTSLVPADRMPEAVGAAIRGGVTLVKLRAKELSTLQQVRLGRVLADVCRAAGVPFVVDDRVDVALAVGADGVHVGHVDLEDMPPLDARRLLGPLAIVGVSVGSVREALAAEESGVVTYVSAGPMFATTTKLDAGPPVGERPCCVTFARRRDCRWPSSVAFAPKQPAAVRRGHRWRLRRRGHPGRGRS